LIRDLDQICLGGGMHFLSALVLEWYQHQHALDFVETVITIEFISVRALPYYTFKLESENWC